MEVNTTCLLGAYEKSMPDSLSLEEKLEAVKYSGFDFLEISIDESNEKIQRLDWSIEHKKELIDAMYRTEMPIKTMCLSAHRKYPLGSYSESTVNRGMEIIEKAIDFACDVGIRIIQIAGYDVYYEESSLETIERFGKNLKKSVAYAAKKGVLLGFENMETEFMNTLEKAMQYVKLINSPYLNVYPDIGNITNASMMYNTDVLDDISKGIGKVVAVHLKETLPGIFREVPFGTGHVEFKRIIKFLRKNGVNMFTGEFWYNENLDWKKELKFAHDFLRLKFD